MESISSMKIIEGACSLAMMNSSLTIRDPSKVPKQEEKKEERQRDRKADRDRRREERRQSNRYNTNEITPKAQN